MKKTFNFQELIKYIEDNKITTCKIETDRGHSYDSLGELLNDVRYVHYDYELFKKLNKMQYTVDVKGMTFEEALGVYRQNTRTLFDVYIKNEKVYSGTLSYALSDNNNVRSYDILNYAEFFISKK